MGRMEEIEGTTTRKAVSYGSLDEGDAFQNEQGNTYVKADECRSGTNDIMSMRIPDGIMVELPPDKIVIPVTIKYSVEED